MSSKEGIQGIHTIQAMESQLSEINNDESLQALCHFNYNILPPSGLDYIQQ